MTIKKLHKAIDEHKAQELDKKFKTNKFAQSYQEDLEQSGFVDEIMEGAEQVKSWNKYGVGYQLVSIQSLFWAFILGFSVCAILLTNFI